MCYESLSEFRKNHDIINGQVIPLIQYIDNDEETHARLSKVSPDCLYTASVDGTDEKGIVNLCEKHGGLVSLYRKNLLL